MRFLHDTPGVAHQTFVGLLDQPERTRPESVRPWLSQELRGAQRNSKTIGPSEVDRSDSRPVMHPSAQMELGRDSRKNTNQFLTK